MAKLPSTTSIVDYLNSQGKDSSFGARRNLFNQAGLDKRLGSFAGSANQNLTLLKNLQSAKNPSFFQGKAPPNAFEAEKGSASGVFDSPVMRPFKDAIDSNRNPSFFDGKAPPNAQEAERQNASDKLKAFSIKQSGASEALRNLSINSARKNNADSAFPSGGTQLQDILSGLGQGGQSLIPQPTAQDVIDRSINEAGGGGQQYQIKSGDTLGKIAKQFGTTVADIARDNNIADVNKISTGTTLNIGGAKNQSFPTDKLPQQTTPQTTPPVQDVNTPTGQLDSSTNSDVGFSASTMLGESTPPNEADLVNDYINSSEGKLLLEKEELKNLTAQGKADAAKQALETKFSSEKEGLENRLASRGLAFSGIRGTQVKALSDSLAASVLGVDRELATLLLEGDIKFRETVLDGVADLIKGAASDRKDEISQLNKIGYAYYQGQLVPTLSRENATIDDIRSDANLAISQRRLELAEQANSRAAATAAKGDTDKEALFATLFAMMADPENETTTPEEWEAIFRSQTDLSGGDIKSVLSLQPLSESRIKEDAVEILTSAYKNPTWWERFKNSGDQKPEAFNKAKKEAIDLLERSSGKYEVVDSDGETIKQELSSSAELDRMKAIINSLTFDEI